MRYTKMHGAGNSFVLTENLQAELEGKDLRILALRLCSPKTGPGADGMIVLTPADERADFGMLFFNSDGSVGEMCGNGARCAARYGMEHGLAPDPDNIRILADAGPVYGRRLSREMYEVRLNDPSVICLDMDAAAGRETVRCSYIELGSPGIPHAVVPVSPEAFDRPDALRAYARALRHSPAFPKGANVTCFYFTGEHRVRAVTFERGVEDFTLACGTGCGATAVSLMMKELIPDGSLEIDMPGGRLGVRLRREENTARDIFLTGPTAIVEEGIFDL